jgi:hypothetical protein
MQPIPETAAKMFFRMRVPDEALKFCYGRSR